MAAKNGVNGTGEIVGEEIQRWTSGRKAAVVLDVIKGRATPADLARQHDLTVGEIEGWVEKFLEGGREGLRAVPRDLEARFDGRWHRGPRSNEGPPNRATGVGSATPVSWFSLDPHHMNPFQFTHD